MCAAHIYCTLGVKFSIRGLHMTLLSIVDFHENCHVKGHTFGAGIHAITLYMYMKLYGIWVVKNALVYSLCYVMEYYTMCSLVSCDHVENEQHSVF